MKILRWSAVAFFVSSIVVVGCGPSLPKDCGCIMSLPGIQPETCIEKSVVRVDELKVSEFVIVESPFNRTNTTFPAAGPVALFEGEVVLPKVLAGGIKRDPAKTVPEKSAWVQPICYAVRIDGGGLSNVVEAGATVFISSDGRDWEPIDLADTAARLKCTGGNIVNTSIARDRASPTKTACSPAPTAKDIADKEKNLQKARSGSRLYFEAGVHGTEASTNPFTQARTPNIVFTCGGCLPVCAPGSCGPDGCGGTCSCADGQTCSAGHCGPCAPQCPSGRCGSDGCGGTCPACPAGETCKSGTCRQCSCPADSCGEDGCGNRCSCTKPGQICKNKRCVDEGTACQPPARWCACTQSCLNPTFCRKREDEGGCVDRLRLPLKIDL